jgi:hypothetical protein
LTLKPVSRESILGRNVTSWDKPHRIWMIEF